MSPELDETLFILKTKYFASPWQRLDSDFSVSSDNELKPMVMSGWWVWWRINSSRDWWVGSLWRVNTIKATHTSSTSKADFNVIFALPFSKISLSFSSSKDIIFKPKDFEFSHPLHSHPTNRPPPEFGYVETHHPLWLNQQSSSSLLMWTHSDMWIVMSKMYILYSSSSSRNFVFSLLYVEALIIKAMDWEPHTCRTQSLHQLCKTAYAILARTRFSL